jgi:hypothetical protein
MPGSLECDNINTPFSQEEGKQRKQVSGGKGEMRERKEENKDKRDVPEVIHLSFSEDAGDI